MIKFESTEIKDNFNEISVYITAPLYWWKEFNECKAGTIVKLSNTDHDFLNKKFELDDFSHEHLVSGHFKFTDFDIEACFFDEETDGNVVAWSPESGLLLIIGILNTNREMYLITKDIKYLQQIIQLLPQSYNQKRAIVSSYKDLEIIYKSKKDDKLDEWSEHDSSSITKIGSNEYFGFCDWIKTLPHSELITGDFA